LMMSWLTCRELNLNRGSAVPSRILITIFGHNLNPRLNTELKSKSKS
jgi:hypothetical protein